MSWKWRSCEVTSGDGGKTTAVLGSFVTSCELVKVEAFAWFSDVLARISDHPVTKLHELLPHRWALTLSSPSSGVSLSGTADPSMMFRRAAEAVAADL